MGAHNHRESYLYINRIMFLHIQLSLFDPLKKNFNCNYFFLRFILRIATMPQFFNGKIIMEVNLAIVE